MSLKNTSEDRRLDSILALKAVRNVLEGFAHDLNNPLAGILGYAHLLQREQSTARGHEFAALVYQQAIEARDLLGGLQDCLAEPELRTRPIRGEDVVTAALVGFRPKASAAGVELVVHASPSSACPEVEGDLSQLRKALGKLLSNALRAAGEASKPLIAVRTLYTDHSATIEVIDNGPGIPAHLREQVFDVGFTTRRSGSGAGLGLSTALHIASRHGGTIEIADADSGALVRLVLPLKTAAAALARPGASKGAADVRVLLVDDQDYILEILADVFDELGCATDRAIDVPEAAAFLKSGTSYDLVVCDFKLPSGTAVDVLNLILAERPDLSSGFVLSSGDIYHQRIQRFLAEHSEIQVLPKPFTVADVQNLLKSRLLG